MEPDLIATYYTAFPRPEQMDDFMCAETDTEKLWCHYLTLSSKHLY